MKHTICPILWNHLSVAVNGDLQFCCEGFPHKKRITNEQGNYFNIQNSESYGDAINSFSQRAKRKKMLNGETVAECGCFLAEKYNLVSSRIKFLKNYSNLATHIEKNQSANITLESITSLDLSLGNICNLGCRMCSPIYSTYLEQEWKKINYPFQFHKIKKIPFKSYIDLLEKLENLNLVYFQGGEPLLHPYHNKILQYFITNGKSKHIALDYNTNLTVLTKEHLKLWKEFKKVNLFISIDGEPALNEYIRYPLKHSVWEENLRKVFLAKVKEEIPIEVSYITVFQLYNVFSISRLLNYLKQFARISCPIPRFIFLQGPNFLSTVHLPEKDKRHIENNIKDFLKKNKTFYEGQPSYDKWKLETLKACLSMMKSQKGNVESFASFFYHTKKLDQYRKQNFFDGTFVEKRV